MDRTLLIAYLAQAERHIREGERHLLRHRQIVDALERHGRGDFLSDVQKQGRKSSRKSGKVTFVGRENSLFTQPKGFA
jgi:hypothetical protein